MTDLVLKRKRSAVDIVFAVLWIAVLLSGLVLKATTDLIGWPHISHEKLIENRKLTPLPEFRKTPVKTWGRACESWYDDHFVMRNDIVGLYKDLHFHIFKSPVKRQVPGYGNWVFGRMCNDGGAGDVWPEVEDYMGAVKLDEKTIDNWKTLFEGRVAWAEAHGIHYLEVIPPMKSAVHPEKMLPMITAHKNESCREDLRDAVAESTAVSNVLFLVESLQAEVDAGHEVFYEEDHHENAYGCYCIYRDITAKMRELWYPEIDDFPFYGENVPQSVKDGAAPGCWVTADRRLAVSNPGMAVVDNPNLRIRASNPRFPHGRVCVARQKPGIKIVVGHDSFLRYPFETWHTKQMCDFAIPVGTAVSQVSMMIFTRFKTDQLDGIVSKELPDVIIEQFSEGRLQFGTNGKDFDYLDDTMRKAAAWSHGIPVAPDVISGVTNAMAMAVLDNLYSSGHKNPVTVELRDEEDALIAAETVNSGIRRAVFFGDIVFKSMPHVVLVNGKAESVRFELRTR